MTSLSTKEYKLYFVWSESCGHCVSFKRDHLENLKQLMSKLGNVEFVSVEGTRENIEKLQCKKYIAWFPTFVLVDRFENVKAIFNCVIDENSSKLVEYQNNHQRTSDGVFEWLNSQLNTKPKQENSIRSTIQSSLSERMYVKSCRTNNFRA